MAQPSCFKIYFMFCFLFFFLNGYLFIYLFYLKVVSVPSLGLPKQTTLQQQNFRELGNCRRELGDFSGTETKLFATI